MKRRAFILSVMFALTGAACGGRSSEGVQASGQIEALEISVAPELSGRVVEIAAREGSLLHAGDVLVRLDDSMLQSQRKAADAAVSAARAGVVTAQNALDTARAQYEVTRAQELAHDQLGRLADWFEADPDQFDRPGWYFLRREQLEAARLEVATAQDLMEAAEDRLDQAAVSLDNAEFLHAEQRLLKARLAYLIRREVNARAQGSTSANQPVGAYNRTHCGTNEGYRLPNQRLVNVLYPCTGDPELTNAGRELYDAAKVELSSAQAEYESLLSTQAADAILEARADLAVAQEYYFAALDAQRTLQGGDQSPLVSAAQGAVNQAEAILEQAQAAEQAAQAGLELIDTQIEKLTLRAPIDGVVLVRSVEVGEVVQAGAPALTLGDLDHLKVTIYLPETQYGKLKLGDSAALRTDSFPEESFAAEIIRISDRAEFTPRNVQTAEGRQTTVYAVELALENPDGKLKPGMPVDVTFAMDAARR